MMRRIVVSAAMVFFAAIFVSAGFTGEVFFEGEGYMVPSEQSQIPFEPLSSLKQHRSAGDKVTVSPLATGFPGIILYTTVLDSSGNPVSGLKQNDFTITEKSATETSATTETITYFNESVSGGGGRISFSLVFDLSGSMSGSRLTEAKEAANNFLLNADPKDRGSLVVFSSGGWEHIVMASDWIDTDMDSNGTYDIIDAINGLSTYGSTAVYDGTALGIQTLSQEPSPKAVIVFTDGETFDDRLYNINTVIAKANNEGVPLYTIGLGLDPQNLKDMASATGGAYYYAPDAQDMTAIYNDIARSIRNQYTIGYTSHNPALDGTTRTVTVTCTGTAGTGFYVVNSKPLITLDAATSQFSSQSQNQGEDLVISGILKDMDAQSLGQSLYATLFYRHVGTDTYTSVTLTLADQGNGVYTFSGKIPGASAVQKPAVQYYIYATDGIQETYLPFNYNRFPYSIAVLPNNAPTVVHTAVSTLAENQAINISATVTDSDSGDQVSDVVLYYRIADPNQDTPYTSVPMTSSNGADYTAQIPGDKVTNAGVEYFISAQDSYGARSDSGTSEQPIAVVPVITEPDTDGDGTADSNDLCPNDPNKTVPGVCGCGVADTDSDGDGILDCEEDDDDDTCFISSSENGTVKMGAMISGICLLFASLFLMMNKK